MSAFGGSGHRRKGGECLLLTQSGHPNCTIVAVQLDQNPISHAALAPARFRGFWND